MRCVRRHSVPSLKLSETSLCTMYTCARVCGGGGLKHTPTGTTTRRIYGVLEPVNAILDTRVCMPKYARVCECGVWEILSCFQRSCSCKSCRSAHTLFRYIFTGTLRDYLVDRCYITAVYSRLIKDNNITR